MEGSKRPRCSRRGEKRRGGEEKSSYNSWVVGEARCSPVVARKELTE